MTLKQLRLKSDLYHHRSKTIKEAALKAGYAESTAGSCIFEMLKNPIYKDISISKEKMDSAFLSVADKAIQEKDFTNVNRSLENVCKLNNLLNSEVTNIQVNVVNDADIDEVRKLKATVNQTKQSG